MVNGRDLPWLQDRLDTLAWNSWEVEIDDVFIVDENGVLVEVYSLLSHDLGDPANYAELKAKLKLAAGE